MRKKGKGTWKLLCGGMIGILMTTLCVRAEEGNPVADAGAGTRSSSLPQICFQMDPNGDDDGPGSPDRPFRSFERTREAVRELRKREPDARIRVHIAPATFTMERTWSFTAEDSGTPENPVIWSAERGTTLTGGVTLKGWKPVRSSDLPENMEVTSTDQILFIDLDTYGITDFGDATTLGKRPELFCDGTPQTLARYPDDGFLKTGEVLGTTKLTSWNGDGAKEGIFRYEDIRIDRWIRESDARLFGYFFWDWADDHARVESIDPTTKTLTLKEPYHSYGYKSGQRFYGVNLFSELDSPGEWYLDRSLGRIYWIPPTETDLTRARVTFSCFPGDTMIVFNGCSDVLFSDVTFTEGRGDAIHVYDGRNIVIANCIVERFGGTGLRITRGERCGVVDSEFRTLGMGGIAISGGDRRTLTPGLNYVLRTKVEDFGRLKRTYAPAVLIEGCGNRIAENLFRRSSSSAIRIEGNDHLIERNRFVEVVQESDDQGGIDIWYNPGYRGIVIRNNYFCDIVGGTHCGAAAIRLDDMISGVSITGNVMERCGSVRFGGVQIHGGKENLIERNLFIDCHAAVSFSRWGEARWLEALERPEMRKKL
ncbi:MAG: right-handed parallel beta-helix repeat-containing protein, partial [Planctomycetia bacterium]|nr:right-handed parallel beta-helix repeat-containing protein [Planctomycetia bacterium]